MKKINADKAWDIEKGSENVTLAILDTGIDYRHEDIGNYAGGFDFVNNDSDPMDDHGHGTAVAGVAAAFIDNERGIAGIAQVNILVLKVLNETGWGTDWDVARAITYAANHSADVISMSFGGDSSAVMEDACDYAWNNNSLLVAASGNENSSVINESASWNGYAGDWHNVSFDVPFVLKANLTYNYTIRTGSYPQIHHTDRLEIDNGVITCISFKDVNGKIHYDWIPAIKLVNII